MTSAFSTLILNIDDVTVDDVTVDDVIVSLFLHNHLSSDTH